MFRTSHSLLLAASLIGFAAPSALAQAVGTSFTYQGKLESAGQPASGLHDLKFRLFNAASGGAQVGPELCVNDIAVVNGQFTVLLDFGAAFAGTQRHLQIDVRADAGLGCTDQTGYETLAPRQNITPAPYALFAQSAGTAASATNATSLNGQPASFYQNATNLTGTLADARLSSNVARLNGSQTFTGAMTFSNAGNQFAGNGAALTNLEAGEIASGTLADARLSSNVALTNASQTFTGTPAFNAGTALLPPFTVDSTTKVTNLNADLLDGMTSSEFLQNGQALEVTSTTPGTESPDVSLSNNLNWTSIQPMREKWQSFTAQTTGLLTGVSIRYVDSGAGIVSFNLRVYAGEGTSGTLLSSTPIVLDTSQNTLAMSLLAIPAIQAPAVTAGQVYTWHIQGGPAWVGYFGPNNPYPGGRASFPETYDVHFGTRVTTGYVPPVSSFAARLGIGTATPASPLHVTAPNIAAANNWMVRITNLTSGTGGIRMSDDGFLDISNTLGNFARLNSTGNWGAVSDARLKADVTTSHGHLASALKLRPVHFRWKESGETDFGFIAQDVREVLPQLVVGDESKTTLTVNYAQMSAVAIGAVQELKAENNELRAENAQVKQRLAALESMSKQGGLSMPQTAGLAAIGLLGFAALRRRNASDATSSR